MDRRRKSLIVLLLLTLLLPCLQVNAHIYQWVDKAGKIHYSDQPLDAAAAVELEIDTQHGDDPYASVQELKPIYYADKHNRARQVVILYPEYALENIKNTPQEIAKLMFGENCVSPTRIRFDDMRSWTGTPLGTGQQLAYRIKRAFDNQNYAPIPSSPDLLMQQLTTTRGLLLVPTINDIYIEACAPAISVLKALKYKEFRRYAYPKVKVYIKLHWILRNNSQSSVLYETDTEAYVNNWTGSFAYRSIAEVLMYALERAGNNLLADEQFVSHMRPVPDDKSKHFSRQLQAGLDQGTLTPATADDFNILRSLDNLSGGYLQAAKLSKVLALMASVKMPVAEYYSQHGQMPGDLYSLGISIPDHILSDNYIHAIGLGPDGVIHADLADDFGTHAVLELLPEPVDSLGLIHWSCMSNLQQHILDKIHCTSR